MYSYKVITISLNDNIIFDHFNYEPSTHILALCSKKYNISEVLYVTEIFPINYSILRVSVPLFFGE